MKVVSRKHCAGTRFLPRRRVLLVDWRMRALGREGGRDGGREGGREGGRGGE